MAEPSRVEAGRNRAAVAKRVAALAAAGGFVVVLGIARQAHPGAAAKTGSQLSTPSALSAQVDNGVALGGGSVASSAGSAAAPQVQSSSS